MRITIAACLAAGLTGLACTDAAAQGRFQAPAATRGFLSVNGVFQATTSSFTERVEFEEFVETGAIETMFDATPALALDGSGGVRLWRNIGIGAGISTYAAPLRNGGRVTARIPHPLDFNKHREVTGDAGLRRKETTIHGNLLYFVPVRRTIQAVIGAGATFFQVEQSFVNDVLYDHAYPFDEATFRGVDIDNESASGLGFNASLDVSWRFSRSLGAGAIVRYTQATLPFTPGDRDVNVTVGGVQAGLGLRIIF
ncbi:MAG: hypothetical protein WD690_17225 [Vicinamibacterales bacterium]